MSAAMTHFGHRVRESGSVQALPAQLFEREGVDGNGSAKRGDME